MIALLQQFKWKRVALVVENADKWTLVKDYLSDKLKDANITVSKVDLLTFSQPESLESMKQDMESLRGIQRHARSE